MINKILFSLTFFFCIIIAGDPAPPAIPEIQAFPEHEKITLYWDKSAENSIDPETGYSDFEGYRLYRSSDGGETWGKLWDKVYDYSGNLVNWKPFAQFDLSEKQDTSRCIYSNSYDYETGQLCVIADSSYARKTDISGYDPLALWVNLGDNTGIYRSYEDTTVIDGVEYTYAVTAYDMGLRSYNVVFAPKDTLEKEEFVDCGIVSDTLICETDEDFIEAYGNGLWDGEEDYVDSNENGLWDGEEDYVDSNENGHWDAGEVLIDCEYIIDGLFCGNYKYWKDAYGNGVWGDSEAFTDSDGNGVWDEGEEFIDCGIVSDTLICANDEGFIESYGNGIWDKAEEFIDCGIVADTTICETDEDFIEAYGNGIWDKAEEFIDCGIASELICDVDPGWIDNYGNGIWDDQSIIYSPDTTWSPSNPDHFTGLNGLGYPSFETPRFKESFSDYNANGTWDEGEPFTDENDDGVWNDRVNPINSITIIPGYFASNILFPDKESDDEIDKFIVGDSLNIGNGFRSYRVVNTGELGSGLIRFEIDACLDRNGYGDQSGSFATGCSAEAQVDCAPGCLELGPPSVYAYEVKGDTASTPKSTNEIIISGFSNDSILFYIGLPGANFNEGDSIVTLPDYIIENHKLTYLDDPNYTANWTEWFNGVQFRFDNGSELIPGGNNVIVRDFELSDTSRADTSLYYRLHGIFRYKANLTEFYSRPNYTYKIEFSTSVSDTAYRVLPLSSCDHLPYDENGDPIKSPLPFKITNLTLDQEVLLWHYDKGIEAGAIEYNELFSGSCDGCNEAQDEVCVFGQCIKRTGYKNCNWELNEILHFTDIVYTDNNLSGDDVKLFEFKLNFIFEEYVKFVGIELNSLSGRLWENGNSYEKDYIVYHEGMLYEAKEEMESSQDPPDIWFDNNGDGLNNNPWQILYPWRDGDYLIIEPYKWFTDGDAWVVDLAQLGEEDNEGSDDLDGVKVVPNPYMVQSRFNEVPGNHLIRFARLPNICEISIYTVTGEFVQKISHNDPYDGNEWWDLKNGQGEFIAPGLYIYVVETPGGEKLIDKFAVIR